MRENFEKPYYGYNLLKYVTIALIIGGIANITLAIIFTILMYSTWILILYWALGLILLIIGMLIYLSFGWMNKSENVELFQNNFLTELKAIWNGKGKVLDMGTGNGRAAIGIAKMFPETQVIGIDTWTKMWGYFGMSKDRAEKNAIIENVSSRCAFQDGNALHLPFKNGEFQLVVSAFVFYEVHVPNRTLLFKEAIRVLAPGGCFMICDLFNSHYVKSYHVKNISELLKKIQQLSVEDVKCKPIVEAGLDFGRLFNIWGTAYLSGRKMDTIWTQI